jgi:DNA-binding CsgD family transcriptional regulator
VDSSPADRIVGEAVSISDSDWPMVGRDRELDVFQALLKATEVQGLVLSGEPGVGKTRLARECSRVADAAGLATAWVTATRSARKLPLVALAPLLPSVDAIGRGDNRVGLLRDLAAHLLDRAGGRRLVLVVDDAHLLDDASATLIHQLAASQVAIIVATLRVDEAAPDPIMALWKDGIAVRVELGGLPADSVVQLLVSALGSHVDQGAVASLSSHSEGNALFLRELTVGALADGTLVNEGGSWQLLGPLAPSDRLVELVQDRLTGLDLRGRNLLEFVAYAEVIGSAELAALSDDEVAADLERRGFLTSRMDGNRLEIRVAHPLYGDVIRARTPLVRVRSMARRLADVVEGTGARRREDALRVATWRLDGGGVVSAQLMLTAATTARWRYDFPLAERLALAAAAAGAGFEAALLAARLASLQGRTEEAERQLALLAGQARTDAERAVAAIARVDNLVFCFGRGADALHVIELVVTTIADGEWESQLAARRSAVLLATRGPAAAAAAAAEVIDFGDRSAQAWASMFLAYVLSRLGRINDALASAARGHSTHRTSELDWYPWFFDFVTCGALARAGRFEESYTLAYTQYEQSLTDGSVEARAYFAWHLARGVTERGDVDMAIEHAHEAARLFRALGRPAFERNALIALALALAVAGRADEATDTLADVEALPVDPVAWNAVELLEARGWTAVASGDLKRGRELLLHAAAVGEQIGDLVGAAAALHGLGRLGMAKQHQQSLRDLASSIEGALVAARLSHTVALSAADPIGLENVSRDFEAMGAHLLAAEAAADAYRAWTRIDDHRAVGARDRARSLTRAVKGADTPGLQLGAAQSQLTVAESETARLAATGLANREIAIKLSLSVRTVENRLQRCYDKLSIRSRHQLAEIFNR